MDQAHAEKIREALIMAKTERRHGETMEQALVRELEARGLVIVEKSSVIASDKRSNPN